jgi:hypothetical protein
VGRYLQLAQWTIGTHSADVQSPAESDDISNRHCRYESNEKNERSLSTTSVNRAPQRQMKTVAAWAAGVARLAAMASHPNYPQHAWQQLVVDAAGFLDDWATQAAVLGWQGGSRFRGSAEVCFSQEE